MKSDKSIQPWKPRNKPQPSDEVSFVSTVKYIQSKQNSQ